eukprot:TRINITY_DN9091_c0_g2_i2.p1 TRINITY_DN9091_c0_g2~~TRINITY_DN9091_c0_g2_i2.p1  ORF type:complete len:175 (+),score=23.10 TRINITY_DN9091_c0_g2_i2:53-526(+)
MASLLSALNVSLCLTSLLCGIFAYRVKDGRQRGAAEKDGAHMKAEGAVQARDVEGHGLNETSSLLDHCYCVVLGKMCDLGHRFSPNWVCNSDCAKFCTYHFVDLQSHRQLTAVSSGAGCRSDNFKEDPDAALAPSCYDTYKIMDGGSTWNPQTAKWD